jgi:hypothetical protein
MPSTLPQVARAALDQSLIGCEIDLRLAAARDALGELLNQLRTRQLLIIYCRTNVRGTRGSTAIAESLRRCSNKAMIAVKTYRRHRAALVILDPQGAWATQLKALADSDIRGINERALTEAEARSRDIASRLQHAADLMCNITAEKEVNDDADGDALDSLPTHTIGARETGEGRRSISWIWHNSPALNEQALTSADPSLVSGQSIAVLLRYGLYLVLH